MFIKWLQKKKKAMIKIARLPAYHVRKGAPGLLVESWALGELLSFQYPWVDSPQVKMLVSVGLALLLALYFGHSVASSFVLGPRCQGK